MSDIGRVARALEIGAGLPEWAKTFRLWESRVAEGQEVALADARALLTKRGGAASTPAPPLELAVGDGIEITANEATVVLTEAQIEDLAPGDYDLVLNLQGADTRWRQIRATVKKVA